MVAGAMRRGDGMRVRVRASAVDGTRRGQGERGQTAGRCARRSGQAAAAWRAWSCARGRQAGHGRGARPWGEVGAGRSSGKREKRKGGPGQPEWSGEEAVRPGDAREQRGRRDRARGVGGRREKEREKKRKRKWEKEKKRKKGGERNKERKRERGGRVGADRGRGRPRVAPGRAGRGETGCWIRVSGLWGIERSGGTGKFPEKLGLGFQGEISSSTTKQNFSA